MTDMMDGFYEQAESLLIATVFLLVIVSVIQVYLRSRSWVPTLGVLLVGAFALWGVNSVEALGRSVDRTIDEAADGGRADRGQFTTWGLGAGPSGCETLSEAWVDDPSEGTRVVTVFMCEVGTALSGAGAAGCDRVVDEATSGSRDVTLISCESAGPPSGSNR